MVVKILQPALSGHFYVLIQLLFHWWRQNCCNNQGLLQPAWQDAANKGGRSSDLLTSEWGCRPFFQRVVAWTHCGCSPLLKRAKYRRVICMCYGTVLSERNVNVAEPSNCKWIACFGTSAPPGGHGGHGLPDPSSAVKQSENVSPKHPLENPKYTVGRYFVPSPKLLLVEVRKHLS